MLFLSCIQPKQGSLLPRSLGSLVRSPSHRVSCLYQSLYRKIGYAPQTNAYRVAKTTYIPIMVRRKAYTKVEKTGQVRPDHVKGMGDVVFKGFQCLNPECEEFIFVRKEDISEFFEIFCPRCDQLHRYGEETQFYNYKLINTSENSVLNEGTFSVLHDDYIDESTEFKYCIICCTLKPLNHFDRHSARKSHRQGECRLCKAIYNEIKNPTRTTDQHREAAQKRRLYMELTGGEKIDSSMIYKRFSYRCFKCGVDLSQDVNAKSIQHSGNLDHTLPAKFLWPLTNQNATLLCQRHNGEKAEKWPSEFYTDQEIRRLVTLTGIPYETMVGAPHYNPEAINRLQDPEFVDALLTKYAAYMEEMITVRNRILTSTGFDMFRASTDLSKTWIGKADQKLIK